MTPWMRATGCLAGVGLLLALMSGGAEAQQDLDSANSMLPHCKRAVADARERALTERNSIPFAEGICTGSIVSLAWIGSSLSGALRFCPPPQATRQQEVRVVIAYIEARPARMHEDYRQLA